MDTSQIFLLFLPILLANPSTAYILRNGEEQGEVACDPAANPSDCPHDRQCKDMDGDGQSTCVCDSRYYTTHTDGHCVLGLKELVYDTEKELGELELKQQQDIEWLNKTMHELLKVPTTTTTTTTQTVPTDQLTHSFCFETCTSGITNDAPGADNSVPPNLGTPPNTCDEGNGVNTGGGFASSNQRITITPNIQTSGPKTGAILVKHISGSEGRTPREVLQNNAFAIHSEPFPAARAFVKNGGTECRFEVQNVYSATEYVLVVVTVDGTNLKMYKNGVEVGSKACSIVGGTSSDALMLGANHFGGSIKSFAFWDRALSAEEVAALDSSKLTCL